MKPNHYLSDMESIERDVKRYDWAVFLSAGLLGLVVLTMAFWPAIAGMFTLTTGAFVLGLFAGSVAAIVALCLVTKPCEPKP